MAEYIDREKIQWHCEYENPHLCNKEDCKNNCPNLECSYQEVMQIPTADVIERSKHLEQVKYIQNNLKTYIDNIRDNYYAIERRYNRLKADVDKAIEELQARADMFNKIGDNNNACTTRSALEILERNIGE